VKGLSRHTDDTDAESGVGKRFFQVLALEVGDRVVPAFGVEKDIYGDEGAAKEDAADG